MPRQTPYLQRRGDTLFFRIAVPGDLRPHIGWREITKSLRTAEKDIAVPIALEYAALVKRVFIGVRAGMAEKNSKTLSELLVGAKHKLRLDELRDRHQDELEERDRTHREELRRVKLEAEAEAMRGVLAGFHTAPLPAPPATSESPTAAPLGTSASTAKKSGMMHRLSAVIPEWKRLKNPALASIEIYEAAAKRFEGHFPALYAETIEKRHIREFVTWLQNEGKSGKTIQKEHGAIRAMLTIAEHEEWITSNPARGTLLPEVGGKKVRSYTPEECRLIFASPVFAKGDRPTGCKGDAAYWIPLLMLHTGARREEICQLTTDRVKATEGVHFVEIDPIDDEGRLKTDESKRAIPVHAQLLELGFLDFVGDRIKQGGRQLFPELKPNARGQYGAKWGDWWRLYIRGEVGITDERISPAHSFRHLFITECRRLAFREDYERALVGHVRGSRKDAHDGYGEHLVPSLAAELNRIDFRGLDLSHLWRR